MIIAIDGPAGAGKSTVARLLAQKLGFLYIDTGAMYRAVTLKALEYGVDFADHKTIAEIAGKANITLKSSGVNSSIEVILDGRDVSREIRHPRVTERVSEVAKIPAVRTVMLGLQRQLGRQQDSVIEGRDIGTVVFPDAERKFYLDASPQERTRRRHKEMVEKGQEVSLEDIADNIRTRDKIDSTRECAPLRRAEDAIYIDTTDMTIEQVVEALFVRIKKDG